MENRDISRAKRDDNGEWVEGFLFLVNDVPYILPHHNTGQPIHGDNLLSTSAEVQKDTICRCTGYEDKNGKLIFENDIVIKHNDDDKEPYLIRWGENYAAWELAQCGCAMYGFFDVDLGEIEVIGNAIDNLELLEV